MIDPLLAWQRIWVLGLHGKVWQIDPLMEKSEIEDWWLCLWEGLALAEVNWDLGEWRWPPLDQSQGPAPFFSYSTRF